jgi:hypothetical protein
MSEKIKNIILVIIICVLLILLNYIDFIKNKKVICKQQPNIEQLLRVHSPAWHEVKQENMIDLKTVEEYDIVKSKIYCDDDGNMVQLLISWSGDGIARRGHPQQICYNASGANIGEESIGKIKVGSKMLYYTAFSAFKTENEFENVIYWRVTGGKTMNSFLFHMNNVKSDYINRLEDIKRVFYILLNREVPDNIMIRASSIGSDGKQKINNLQKFIQDYLMGLSEKELKIVIGD